ncbi:MAG: hypothetical protein P8Y54_07330 [Xanthomonadales bacterium]
MIWLLFGHCVIEAGLADRQMLRRQKSGRCTNRSVDDAVRRPDDARDDLVIRVVREF